MSYRTGQVIGQPIGGILAHPERATSYFDTEFWREYPYALPCIFSGLCTLVAVFWGCFTLSEVRRYSFRDPLDDFKGDNPQTLPAKIREHKRQSSYGSVSSDDTFSDDEESMQMKRRTKSPWRAVMTPHVKSLLLSLTTMVLASEILFAL